MGAFVLESNILFQISSLQPNVLISDDGHALLTDFGFSHLANASFSLAVEQRPGGTPNWMPPEYLEADQCVMTAAGDVWSFGMTALVSHLNLL